MADFSCASTKRTSHWLAPMSWKPPVRFRVSVVVAVLVGRPSGGEGRPAAPRASAMTVATVAANRIGLGCPDETKPLRRSHEKRVLSDSNGGASLADYVAPAPNLRGRRGVGPYSQVNGQFINQQHELARQPTGPAKGSCRRKRGGCNCLLLLCLPW